MSGNIMGPFNILVFFCFGALAVWGLWLWYETFFIIPMRECERWRKENERSQVYRALEHAELKEMVNNMPNDLSTYTRNKRNALEEMRNKLRDSWGEE